MNYGEWKEVLFAEIGEDEDLFTIAGENYLKRMWE